MNIPTPLALTTEIGRRFAKGEGFALATINLDHLAKMSRSPEFAAIYASQDLIVADGRPVVALARLARQPVELMPGSDLIEPLCRLAAGQGIPVAMIGSSDEALADAKRILGARIPGLDIRLSIAPPQGFDPASEVSTRILAMLEPAGVRLCFLALGAPKQEKTALIGRRIAPSVGFVSIGAGLDFLGGHQRRAPKWVRELALEWLWRALSNPRRLLPRYIRCAAILPRQIWLAWQQRRKAR